jgi:catechol 2,3-dioxygenase-like lactoylglutathione lyase family enzyme
MLSFSRISPEAEIEHDTPSASAVVAQPKCYGITIFTLHYAAVRDFYVNLLNGRVLHEKAGRFCELDLAGIPICLRQADHSEMVSYFHLHLVLKRQDSLLGELRRQGIVVTTVGPFTNFRDPEGRVIKLSEEQVAMA